MRVRLYHITTKRSGTRAVREEIVDAAVLTIGRAPASIIEVSDLTAALHHAALHYENGDCWVQAVDGDAMRVDGRLSSRQALDLGSVIRIASRQITVVAAKPTTDDTPEDFGLELETIESNIAADQTRIAPEQLTIERGLLNRRPLSWLAALAVLGLFLAVPLLQPVQQIEDGFTEASVETAPWRNSLTASWLSGPMRPSHSHFGDHCTVCHTQPFEAVADESCIRCHAQQGPHLGADQLTNAHAASPCADCHSEHEDSAATAVLGDSLCASCHDDLAAEYPETNLANAADFATNHSPFRATLPPVGDEGSMRKVYGEENPDGPDATVSPPTGLAFSHKVHLKEGLRGAQGPVTMACSDCHDMDERGGAMQGLSFENSCRSCHSLGFDTEDPERQVQHGVPLVVERELFEFYAGRALRRAGAEGFTSTVRRRPGHAAIAELDQDALALVNEQTKNSAERLLGSEGVCAECHRISPDANTVVIAPVRIGPYEDAERWLPLTDFGHRSHSSVECSGCHDARAAETAETLILPQISVCRTCHAGETPTLGFVASPCTMCHDFHREEPAATNTPPSPAPAHPIGDS